MRGLINHTWSQPLFLFKSLEFRISGRNVFSLFQKTSGWCLVVTVNCWDDIHAGKKLISIVHTNANISCFCLAIECEIVFLKNRCAYNTMIPQMLLHPYQFLWFDLFHACQAPCVLSELWEKPGLIT